MKPAPEQLIGVDEVLLGAGLLLLTFGLWAAVGMGALIAPGGVLLYVALPARRPFVVERPLFETKK